jgi:hypothetical protein
VQAEREEMAEAESLALRASTPREKRASALAESVEGVPWGAEAMRNEVAERTAPTPAAETVRTGVAGEEEAIARSRRAEAEEAMARAS